MTKFEILKDFPLVSELFTTTICAFGQVWLRTDADAKWLRLENLVSVSLIVTHLLEKQEDAAGVQASAL